MLITNIRRWYFLIFSVIAILVYGAQQFHVILPEFVNNYLNDLLCIPIVLKISQYAVRFIKKDQHLLIPIQVCTALTILYVLYFEYLLPRSNDRYTADAIDVLLYFAGLFFFLWIEGSLKKGRVTSN